MKRPTFKRGIIFRIFLVLALVAGMTSFPGRGARAAIDTASFAAKVDFSTGTTPEAIAIGDLDGDGKPDLAVANTFSDTVSVLRNTSTSGSLSFAAKVDFSTGNHPVSVAIGDGRATDWAAAPAQQPRGWPVHDHGGRGRRASVEIAAAMVGAAGVGRLGRAE